jgi:hypothetical protein
MKISATMVDNLAQMRAPTFDDAASDPRSQVAQLGNDRI